MKLPKFVYYLNEPGTEYYYGTREGSPFRSKPHAELQAKGSLYKVAQFVLVNTDSELYKIIQPACESA